MSEDNKSIIVSWKNKLEKIWSLIKITNKLINKSFNWEKWWKELDSIWKLKFELFSPKEWIEFPIWIFNKLNMFYLRLWDPRTNFFNDNRLCIDLTPLRQIKTLKYLIIEISWTPSDEEDLIESKKYKFDLKLINNFENLIILYLIDYNNNFINYDIIYSLKNLWHLAISNFHFDLWKIKYMVWLDILTIDNNQLFTNNLYDLRNTLNIKTLNIDHWIIDNETLLNISTCSNLEKISFKLVNITENNLDFSPIFKLSKLKEITVYWNENVISFSKILSKLKFPNLKIFCLLWNNIPEDLITQFKSYNPYCIINTDKYNINNRWFWSESIFSVKHNYENLIKYYNKYE